VNQVLLKARVGASLEKKRLGDQQKAMVRRFATFEVDGGHMRRLLSRRRLRWGRSPPGRAGLSALDLAHAPTVAERDPLTKFVIVGMATTFERTDVGR
jgi:hypothetical protein